jgi:hypothetical protein
MPWFWKHRAEFAEEVRALAPREEPLSGAPPPAMPGRRGRRPSGGARPAQEVRTHLYRFGASYDEEPSFFETRLGRGIALSAALAAAFGMLGFLLLGVKSSVGKTFKA